MLGRGFKKITVDGCIRLGSRHALLQERREDPAKATAYVRSIGSTKSFKVGVSDGIGQPYDFSFSKKPIGELKIDGAGMVTSFGIFGAPGCGKTVLLMHLLEQVLAHAPENSDKRYGALILDPKATLIDEVIEIVERAGRLGDLRILNTDLLTQNADGINVIDCSLDPQELGGHPGTRWP